MEKKTRTVAILKAKRQVPESVQEARKKYIGIRKAILESFREEGRTIPQLAKLLNLTSAEITYYLMTLQKFGDIEVEGVDDKDEYYIYKLKNR